MLCRVFLLLIMTLVVQPFALQAASQQHQEVEWKPLIVYYSLSGSTAVVARELECALGCRLFEITSLRRRTGFWTVNCVIDQLFDRDDLPGPVTVDAAQYNPLILACPIWIHRFASPMRTFLAGRSLDGKEVFVIVTHQGNCGVKDEQAIRRFLAGRGMQVKGYAAVLTRNRTQAEIIDATRQCIEQNFFDMEKAVSITNN